MNKLISAVIVIKTFTSGMGSSNRYSIWKLFILTLWLYGASVLNEASCNHFHQGCNAPVMSCSVGTATIYVHKGTPIIVKFIFKLSKALLKYINPFLRVEKNVPLFPEFSLNLN